jgi:Protein of unknown function (DUF3995)
VNPIPAAILFCVFVALSVLHFYWALGGRRGLDAAIPTNGEVPVFRPGIAAAALVAVVLLAAAYVVVWRAVTPDFGPAWLPRIGVWIVAIVMALRAIGDFRYVGLFKRVRGTVFSRNDTWFYSPFCAVVSGLAVWVAIGL